ncbi:MAG: FeoA family protein [Halanaerobacter sp.]
METITLHQLSEDEAAKVVGIDGGCGLEEKLNNLGVRAGKEITKVNDSFVGGPVTVKVDNAKVAIGHGMAKKIMVEVE